MLRMETCPVCRTAFLRHETRTLRSFNRVCRLWERKRAVRALPRKVRQCQFAALRHDNSSSRKSRSFVTDLQHEITSVENEAVSCSMSLTACGLASPRVARIDLADEKLEDAFVAGFELGDVVGILLDDLASGLFDFWQTVSTMGVTPRPSASTASSMRHSFFEDCHDSVFSSTEATVIIFS